MLCFGQDNKPKYIHIEPHFLTNHVTESVNLVIEEMNLYQDSQDLGIDRI
jgi:hypothetical protein